MNRALVTGADTPLGVSLCQRLRKDRVTVIATARDAGAGVDIAAELSRPRALHDLLFGPAAEVDTVFHLAAYRADIDRAEHGGHRHDTDRAAHAMTVETLRQLLELSERHGHIARVVVRSHADVYLVEPTLPTMVSEAAPLNHGERRTAWLRDRVEADALACARIGTSTKGIFVLRLADVFAAGTGSWLHAYFASRLCLRPLGFDPMINLLSLDDAARALALAGSATAAHGVLNVPGYDTLPLSVCARKLGKLCLPLPNAFLSPLYALRQRATHVPFSYDASRFHYQALLSGALAEQTLGYVPRVSALG